MINIAICDSNKDDRQLLEKFILSFLKDKNLEYKIILYDNGNQLLKKFSKGFFDLLFLEIKSSHCKNVSVGNMIRRQDACIEIVYCSTNCDFALKSHDTFCLGYLLKPFLRQKVVAIMDHYLLKNYTNEKKFIRVKYKRENHILFYNDIIYISSNNKIVTFYTLNQGEFICYRKLKSIQEELHDERFLKCNRSFIINMDFITGIIENDFVTINNHLVSIKLRERKNIINAYYEYLENSAIEEIHAPDIDLDTPL